jgi:type IV fimbrial biogenesis protein FimT
VSASGTRAAGFTLTELLVVVTITGILTAAAVPALRPMLARNAVSGQVNGLLGALAYARAEAVSRGLPVSLCRLQEGTTAQCAGAGEDWSGGALVFVDGDTPERVDGTDVRLRVFPGADHGFELRGVTASGAAFGALTWNGTGDLVTRPTGGAARFAIHPKSASEASFGRLVCLSPTGRARIDAHDSNCGGS